jgi:hypothetical protein
LANSCHCYLSGAGGRTVDLERRTPSRPAHRCAQHRNLSAIHQRPRRHGHQR